MLEKSQNNNAHVTNHIVFATAVLAIVTILIFGWMSVSFHFKPKLPLKDFRSPVVAMELARTSEEFVRIAGDKEDLNRTIIRKNLTVDYFFIAAYWSLFVCMAVLLARRNFSGAYWLSIVVGMCATGAAVFDMVENIRIFKVLPLTLTEKENSLISSIRNISLCKWALLFVTSLLIAPLYLWRDGSIAYVGTLLALGAVIGLPGLLYHPAIEWASLLMGICIVLIAVIFTFYPKKFLKEF